MGGLWADHFLSAQGIKQGQPIATLLQGKPHEFVYTDTRNQDGYEGAGWGCVGVGGENFGIIAQIASEITLTWYVIQLLSACGDKRNFVN